MTPTPRRSRTVRPSGYQKVVAAVCRLHGWPEPIAEHRFDAVRRWRLDLAWPDVQLAVEVQGGTFTRGRHSRGPAMRDEYEKLNAAAVAGWTVLLLLPEQLTSNVGVDTLRGFFTLWYPKGAKYGRSARE